MDTVSVFGVVVGHNLWWKGILFCLMFSSSLMIFYNSIS